ncbi:hypothetical protein F4861DRAFT_532688 [Xylaria intraflava]|nr:hypothetical protein F4861DRAFT_532688 [Xylaria intraflava]
MPNPADYTVGWMCAIGEELIAAQAVLDEKHATLSQVPVHDNNSYTLGRVGNHNVVIAAMPHRQYGLVSAAVVARDMVRSFPNVRIGLMVGIGGGAPSPKHDIRLGDVVISSPGCANSGVLQYDYGKTVQDQSFTATGYLNQPPLFMMTALATLKAEHEAEGHTIDTAIETFLEKKPRLRTKYRRPDPSTDILYKTHWKHAGGKDDNCQVVCGTGRENIVNRPERLNEENSPAIHYGLIASANQLMKDAVLRDKLSAEKDVLCFEMEAAGLMNHFPCLVIRGICDYADTHKNTLWQGYAAMTAATYARDFLYNIAPEKVEAEGRLGELLLDGECFIANNIAYRPLNHMAVREGLEQVKTGVDDIKAHVRIDHIAKWLSPPNPSTNVHGALNSRHPGSGKWLLDHPAYLSWKSKKDTSILWLYGIPGCGKTVLTSTIIEDLTKPGTSQNVLYFYFDFNDTSKQNFDMMLRSLISQLYGHYKNADVRGSLDALYSSCDDGQKQPRLESLCATFRDMVQRSGTEIWVAIDALDECTIRQEYPNKGLLPWIQDVGAFPNIHLLITSRPEQDIEAAIRKSTCDSVTFMHIQSSLVKSDIDAYVRSRVRSHGQLRDRWNTRPDIQARIEDTLIEKADGMFRLVSCHLDQLEKCYSPPEIRKELVNLPQTLDETYARVIDGIRPEHKRNATRLLQFLTYSERPLTLQEAVDCITIDMDTQQFDPNDRLPVPTEISRYCSSLVSIAKRLSKGKKGQTKTIIELRLAHYSVKEYLSSGRLKNSIAKDLETVTARASIANLCLIYLLRLEHSLLVGQVRQVYPLASYAAKYWPAHAVAANEGAFLDKSLMAAFFASSGAFNTCFQLYPFERSRYGTTGAPHILSYAAFFGLSQAVQMLLDNGVSINLHCEMYGDALQAASYSGHENTVQMLLERGADINMQGGIYGSALRAASYSGHEKVVQVLLEKGADVNAQNGKHDNALRIASYRGYENIVRMLLDKGANVNAQDGEYSNVLHIASSSGHENIVRMLLEKGADVNAQGGEHGSALHAASYSQHESIVQMLLEKGANVNAPSRMYGSALHAAIAPFSEHENIARILLANGADVNGLGGIYGRVLQAASYSGHENIVRMLLERGADVDAQGGAYGNALGAASFSGHENIVRMLLHWGADVTAQGGKHRTSLVRLALSQGHGRIAHLLQTCGAYSGWIPPDTYDDE